MSFNFPPDLLISLSNKALKIITYVTNYRKLQQLGDVHAFAAKFDFTLNITLGL